jgi:hypothetical protein
MKICALIAFFALFSLARGVTKQDLAANERAKLAALELFRANDRAGALAHLRSSLQPEPGPDGSTSALVQGLIEMSCTLYNRRELRLARQVLGEAISAVQPILDRRSAVAGARGSELASSLGILSEHVFFDNKQAEALYNAAASLNPSNRLNSNRRDAVVEKQKPRGGVGGS